MAIAIISVKSISKGVNMSPIVGPPFPEMSPLHLTNFFKNIRNSMVTCGHVCDVDGDETVDDVEMTKSCWRWKKMHYDDLPIYGCQELEIQRTD